MQYTIEAREITRHAAQQPSDGQSRRTTIEAHDADDAITQFVRTNRSELVSVARPGRGSESIATVKKGQAVYLVRVYAQ